MIDPDDFDDWLAHPMTRAMQEACRRWAQEAKDAWSEGSWQSGIANETRLAELRAQAFAFQQIATITRQQIEEALE